MCTSAICTVCRKGILESWYVRVQEIMICTVCRKGILESWCVGVQEIMICTVCRKGTGKLVRRSIGNYDLYCM